MGEKDIKKMKRQINKQKKIISRLKNIIKIYAPYMDLSE